MQLAKKDRFLKTHGHRDSGQRLAERVKQLIKRRDLKSAAVVFFMVMSFGTAQDTSSSFYVFAGHFGFERLQD